MFTVCVALVLTSGPHAASVSFDSMHWAHVRFAPVAGFHGLHDGGSVEPLLCASFWHWKNESSCALVHFAAVARGGTQLGW
jgi:hypothetical protein